MKKQICIVYEPCDEIKQGKSVITGDGSMIYVPSPSICPFSVYPYHWSFEIATSVVTENKYKLEHFLGNQVFLSCETAKLKKPTASAGCIYVEIDFPHADGVYYSQQILASNFLLIFFTSYMPIIEVPSLNMPNQKNNMQRQLHQVVGNK